jgi:hypothetical protein
LSESAWSKLPANRLKPAGTPSFSANMRPQPPVDKSAPPMARLNALTKARQRQFPGESFARAFSKIYADPANRALAVEERNARLGRHKISLAHCRAAKLLPTTWVTQMGKRRPF